MYTVETGASRHIFTVDISKGEFILKSSFLYMSVSLGYKNAPMNLFLRGQKDTVHLTQNLPLVGQVVTKGTSY